jgi:AraC-like DNA-binding protein
MLDTMHLLMPSPALRPYVRQLWISQSAERPECARERLLPTGEMHLVFRLDGPALRLFDDKDDLAGSVIREPVVGGPRATHYTKESGGAVRSAGVQLLPGAAMALFGVSAAELAGRHTVLSELWGAQGRSALDRIASAKGAQQQLRQLQALLTERLPRPRAMHPAVAHLLAVAGTGVRIDAVVRNSQYSHRGFIALFKQTCGMSPKRYARLMRFRSLLAALRAPARKPLGELALDAGYSDQAHMQRDFREFTGMTPLQYCLLAPAEANHVPLPEVKFVQDGRSRAAYSEAFQPEGSLP